jgi:hypothetical protein
MGLRSDTDCVAACRRVFEEACPDEDQLTDCAAGCVTLPGFMPTCLEEFNALERCISKLPNNQFDCSTRSPLADSCTNETTAYATCIVGAVH